MLKRKVLDKLDEWYINGAKKVLLINGARQVGKTTAVRLFSQKHYKNYIEINFVKNPVAIEAFEGNLDTATIVANLSAMGFGPFVRGETLVFLMKFKIVQMQGLQLNFLLKNIGLTI